MNYFLVKVFVLKVIGNENQLTFEFGVYIGKINHFSYFSKV